MPIPDSQSLGLETVDRYLYALDTLAPVNRQSPILHQTKDDVFGVRVKDDVFGIRVKDDVFGVISETVRYIAGASVSKAY